MRIPCPFCGVRDSQEFSFLGAAGLQRPDPNAANAATLFHDYVHIRDNKAGVTQELWLHSHGCRSWIVVERNTLTHEITASDYASDVMKEASQ
jgi:methylglutamate dehydrogenase subunit B